MKIALILGSYSVGSRPLDFNNIWKSSRGLTGTDLSLIMIGKELVKKEHEVHIFTVNIDPSTKPEIWEEIYIHNLNECPNIIDHSFAAVLSINEPDVFRFISDKPLRICWQFLNDFPYCIPEFDGYVDQWLGVCEQHTNYLIPQVSNTKKEKWKSLGLGCSPELYEDKRMPGRVVWCSSADRGLHWLLQEWPKIKAAIPYATLRIFYHFNYGDIEKVEPNSPSNHSNADVIKEMGQRVRYIKYAVERLKRLDVEHIGSIGRERMRQELNEASVFGYCCDTVNFSEGFSVATLEAHASYTVPIITSKDCLGLVYKDSGAIVVEMPVKDNVSKYSDYVIQALKDKYFADNIISKCRAFAIHNSWEVIVDKLEYIIKEHTKYNK